MQSYTGDVKIMDIDYANYIEKYDYPKIIDFPQAFTAFALNDFFIQQKLTLAGFDSLGNNNNKNEDAVKSMEQPIDSLERKILLSAGQCIFLSILSKANTCRKINFEKSCANLQQLNLGTLGQKCLGNAKKTSTCFTKIDIRNLKTENEKLTIINNLLTFFY